MEHCPEVKLERLRAQLDILTAKRDSVARTHGGGTRLLLANLAVSDIEYAIWRLQREQHIYWLQSA
jgi:hypothetical protein